MQASLANVSIVIALIASVLLLLQAGGDRLVPAIAVLVTGIEALMAFGLMSVAFAKFRIDVILPALLFIAGAVCWARAAGKPAITSATVVALVGAIQLVNALHIFT